MNNYQQYPPNYPPPPMYSSYSTGGTILQVILYIICVLFVFGYDLNDFVSKEVLQNEIQTVLTVSDPSPPIRQQGESLPPSDVRRPNGGASAASGGSPAIVDPEVGGGKGEITDLVQVPVTNGQVETVQQQQAVQVYPTVEAPQGADYTIIVIETPAPRPTIDISEMIPAGYERATGVIDDEHSDPFFFVTPSADGLTGVDDDGNEYSFHHNGVFIKKVP